MKETLKALTKQLFRAALITPFAAAVLIMAGVIAKILWTSFFFGFNLLF